MATLKLDNDFTLGAEIDNKRIRLIVYRGNNVEWVCCKTNLNEISRFLKGTEPTLLKGRLQLLKDQDTIVIKV
ncbi:MAG: hypothetical protein JWP37_3642 [Mucilaginibacter sp.]|nr:hypothetical protein [Mucilaginibacter sp.]